MNLNPNANEELDCDTRDTDQTVGPFECDYCGEYADSLVTFDDSDPSVGYHDTLNVCANCAEAKR